LELDGTTAVWAVARAGIIRDVDQVTSNSPEEALTEAIRRSGAGSDAIVAWAADVETLWQAPFPLVAETNRRQALDALTDDRGGLACARLGPAVPGRNERLAVIATADPDEVAGLWRGVGSPNLKLMLAPLLLADEGLFLGIGRRSTHLTVVADGIPKRSRQLSSGGLDALAATLGAYGGDGWGRLERVLSGWGDAGTDALKSVDAHVAALCSEVLETLSSWRRSDRVDTSVVIVYGAGSALPTLEARLGAAGVQALAPPQTPACALDTTTRAEGWCAILAALAQPDTCIGLPDLGAAAHRAALSRAARQTRRLALRAAAIAVAVLGVVVPLASGRITKRLAAGRLSAARREIAKLAPEEATFLYVHAAADAWTATAATEPDWARTLDAILRTAPTSVRVANVDVDDTTAPGQVTATVHADGRPEAFADLEAWAATLAANKAVSKVFTPSAQSDAQPGRPSTRTTFELEFQVTASVLVTPRPFPGGSP
jgi:hypothetical protein